MQTEQSKLVSSRIKSTLRHVAVSSSQLIFKVNCLASIEPMVSPSVEVRDMAEIAGVKTDSGKA